METTLPFHFHDGTVTILGIILGKAQKSGEKKVLVQDSARLWFQLLGSYGRHRPRGPLGPGVGGQCGQLSKSQGGGQKERFPTVHGTESKLTDTSNCSALSHFI